MTTEDRKAFEEWVSERDGSTMRAKNNRYIDAATDHYWMAWQAAAARERERCAGIAETEAREAIRNAVACHGEMTALEVNESAAAVSAAIRARKGGEND